MQIPATSSAAQAAGIVAQSNSKDVAADGKAASANVQAAFNATVEKTGSANPDRDAQGQGDGFVGHSRKEVRDEIEIETEGALPDSVDIPHLSVEPPSQLDIIG